MSTHTELIERNTMYGVYGILCDEIIIDRPKQGRLHLSESFGGMDDLCGGSYRWRHGTVVSLLPGDTLESLRAGKWNEFCTLYDAVTDGYDPDRPILNWPGYMIARVAELALKNAEESET